jgi:hypothetical protein
MLTTELVFNNGLNKKNLNQGGTANPDIDYTPTEGRDQEDQKEDNYGLNPPAEKSPRIDPESNKDAKTSQDAGENKDNDSGYCSPNTSVTSISPPITLIQRLDDAFSRGKLVNEVIGHGLTGEIFKASFYYDDDGEKKCVNVVLKLYDVYILFNSGRSELSLLSTLAWKPCQLTTESGG